MTVINDHPRPWILVVGIESDDPYVQFLGEIVPKVVVADNPRDVRDLDFDAAVIRGPVARWRPADHLNILWFSDEGRLTVENTLSHQSMISPPYWGTGDHAARFTRTPEADQLGVAAETDQLAHELDSDYPALQSIDHVAGQVRPLLKEAGGQELLLAGIVGRGKDAGPEVWCLPDRAFSAAQAWTRAALRSWTEQFPDRFPSIDWEADNQWMTAAERYAVTALAEHNERSAQTLAEIAARTAELEGTYDMTRRAATAGLRRLLLTNGDELVAAATTALQLFGFEVIDVDAERAGQEKLEDLRVIDDEWVCLVEIKGYEKRNAKANDLLQLGKAVEQFIKRTGNEPSARWYLINQSFATPPAERRPPLEGSDMIETFASQSGLVVDTRDLFRLTVAVESAEITAADARDLLKGATGVLEYPSAATK